MLAKLATIVIALTLTAASMLAVRQQRLQAVSDMATAIERASALERQTWRARLEIARRVSPDALERALEAHGEFRPMVVEWCEIVEIDGPAFVGEAVDERSEPGRGHGG